MREIVLDTETTGLDPASGDRIVEIGAVELLNHVPTGQTFHVYLNPDRDMPAEAEAVHGLSAAFLADKPRFAEVAEDFLAFIGDSLLVIHNASFDVGFLNAELSYLRKASIAAEQVIDTLHLARKKHPGSPNSLDALCRRYGIDNTRRTFHGALLDAELLAEVYLELIGGRQTALVLDTLARPAAMQQTPAGPLGRRPSPLPSRLTDAELSAHRAFVEGLGDKALWMSGKN